METLAMRDADAVAYLKEKRLFYERKISEIRAKISSLETEANYLQGLLKSANSLLREELGASTAERANTGDELSEKLRALSLSEGIYEIVNASKGPIHADQVLKRLRESGKVLEAKNPKNSIVTLLHRGVKAGLYAKVGPNLYSAFQTEMLINRDET
ncbi:MAG: hypothetical protein KIS74_16470 [Burkholderiales bacterium]|nr:hypothetical protein [Burkholderiales bacterium]